jgi:hypothetical protein
MTTEEKINYIRAVGDFNEKDDDDNYVDSDEVISAFLLKAETEIMNRAYPYGYAEDAELPKKYEILSCDIVVFLLNKRGAEGEIDHSENGVSRSYMSAHIPEDMLTPVIPHCASFGGSDET